MSAQAVVLRSSGIGGTDISAIVGMNPYRDAFAVYADKMGLIERQAPSPRMLWGKRLEKLIAEAWSEETGRPHRWVDETLQGKAAPFQVYTPDAMSDARGVDCKTAGLDRYREWGESGTDQVPDHYALQAQWYMSAADVPLWDIAVLIAGSDFRIYTLARDPDIESTLLEEGEKFWRVHIIGEAAPPIGSSSVAAEYLRRRFPKNVEQVREATREECELLRRYASERHALDGAKLAREVTENELKLAVGDADGIQAEGFRFTWKLNRGKKAYSVAAQEPSRQISWSEPE